MRKGGNLYAAKNHFVASLGEFVGTFLFLFFAFAGTQTANSPLVPSTTGSLDLTTLLYISLIFGFSLAINVWVFFRISGGLFNPAVTLALCVCGVVPVIRSLFVFVAQVLGGIAAAAVVRGLLPGNDVLFNVGLTDISVTQGLFLEMFMTAELVFTILMLAAEKTKATFVAPVGIGLALFVSELIGVAWTGGALNPARALGPAVVKGHFNSYDWIYWVGPCLGGLLASAFYGLNKFLNYEEANGDQDKSADEPLEYADEPEDEESQNQIRPNTKENEKSLKRGSDAFDRRYGAAAMQNTKVYPKAQQGDDIANKSEISYDGHTHEDFDNRGQSPQTPHSAEVYHRANPPPHQLSTHTNSLTQARNPIRGSIRQVQASNPSNRKSGTTKRDSVGNDGDYAAPRNSTTGRSGSELYSSSRTVLNGRSAGDNARTNRAFAPAPPPLRYGAEVLTDQPSRRTPTPPYLDPAEVRGDDGRVYHQDENAQLRGDIKGRGGSLRENRQKQMELEREERKQQDRDAGAEGKSRSERPGSKRGRDKRA